MKATRHNGRSGKHRMELIVRSLAAVSYTHLDVYKRQIQYGEADIMLAGGTESCICPTGVAGFQQLTALSTETEDVYKRQR